MNLPNNDTVVEINEKWELELTDKIQPKYGMAYTVSQWLKNNLTELKDDNNETIFSKVNLGFTEDNLKTFGTKPVCDVYINNVSYDPTFDYGVMDKVNSIIIFYSKGTSDNSYLNACQVHDYLLQEFITNDDFRQLGNIVRDTYITSSQLMMQPIRKKWGVMGAFELSHLLFY